MTPFTSVIYYIDEDGFPQGITNDGEESLGVALKEAERLRKEGFHHVTISTENSNSVGKPGVDVTNDTYNWKKRRP